MRSLRAKLIMPFLLGVLVLTLLLSWYTYTSARKAVDDAMLLISEAKTNQAAGSMALLFKSMSTNLQNMVADPHVTGLFTPGVDVAAVGREATSWFETITQGNEFYRDIFVVDKKGVCIASSNPGHVGNSYLQTDGVTRALGGMFNFSDAAVGRVTKKFSVTMAGPVDSERGLEGALVLVSDFPKIVDYEPSNHSSQVIFTALLTPEGLFMAHKDQNLMGNTAMQFPELYAGLESVGEKGARVEYMLDGEDYVGFARMDPSSKWLVITSGKQAEVFAPAYQVGFVVLGISLIFLIGVSLVVFRQASGILNSLFSLITYAKTVSEGTLDAELKTAGRNDELGILHASLQSLVASMKAMLDKTEAASRMKGEFLANMSHEIRTPLNAIIGMTHLSLREGSLPPKQRGYLDRIQLAARSLLGVINDILDLSKVEAGMLVIEKASFNLHDVVANTLEIHRQNAEDKGLSLVLDFDAGLEGAFVGDSLRIGQVLNNLVGNALKFTHEGGVRLLVYPQSPEAGGRVSVAFSVIDTGIGMDQATQDNLFQPFSQADASITRRFGGTGLGLAISHRLVSLMQGTFSVSAELGAGTTFHFFIPLEHIAVSRAAEEKDEAGQADSLETLDLRGKRVLLAEDNEINRFLLQELLAPTGVTLFQAENGLAAVEFLQKESVDLVLMDLQMPVMDGMEATRVIRQEMDGMALPIIAVTANAMEDEKNRGLSGGMNDYITKPIEPKELLRVLKEWL